MSRQDIFVRSLQSNNSEGSSWSAASQQRQGIISSVMIIVISVLGLIWLRYVIANLKDRWSRRGTPIVHVTYSLNNQDRSSETKSKTIWLRLTPEERAKILKAFFEKRLFFFNDKTRCSGQLSGETDVEKGEAAVTFCLPENDEPSSEATGAMMTEQVSSHKQASSANNSGQRNDIPTFDSARECKAEIKLLDDREKEVAGIIQVEKNDRTEVDQGENAVEVDDMDHEHTCCVCLSTYEEGNQLITGTQCNHVFHYACCMAWLNKNLQCPYCRQAMITEAELLQAACDVLEPERVKELSKTENLDSMGTSGIVSSGGGVSPPATISTTTTSTTRL